MGALGEETRRVNAALKRRGIAFEGKRVLVTGGAGFLGSWVCEALVAQGAQVTCVDNLASGLETNIARLRDEEGFEFIRHDITKEITFDSQIDLVLHMASRASPFEFDRYPIQILKANTLGIWVALGIAKKHGARFLYTSTSEIYGDPDPRFVPTPETYNGNVNPVGKRSCYDEAKRCGEAFVIAYHHEHKLDTRMVRIFNTYGPRMRAGDLYGRAVPRFIEQALEGEPITVFGDGGQTRSFTYVADQVRGILSLAGAEDATGEVVNIGNNNETSILKLAKLIKKLTGSRSEIAFLPLPEDDPKRRCPDITKAKKLLGWTPEVALEEGLERTIGWFRQNNESGAGLKSRR